MSGKVETKPGMINLRALKCPVKMTNYKRALASAEVTNLYESLVAKWEAWRALGSGGCGGPSPTAN